jgi:U2-associated protein SR140
VSRHSSPNAARSPHSCTYNHPLGRAQRRAQEERDERHQLKKAEILAKTGNSDLAALVPPPIEEAKRIGSYDSGDPNTTNLYLGNLSPDISEQLICEAFGRFGPLASVKVMWPRTDEEQLRPTRSGFVAYMTREDAERAYDAMVGEKVLGMEVRLSWGKCVQIPAVPVYAQGGTGAGAFAGVLHTSGLPFNAFLARHNPQVPYDDEDIMEAVVTVCVCVCMCVCVCVCVCVFLRTP